MEKAFIIDAARSPMGRSNKGSYVYTRIDDVASQVVTALLKKNPDVDLNLIEDLIVGCAMPEGEQGLNVARNIGLLSGLPLSSGGVTVNRFCASSLETINIAFQSIMCGNGELFIAGGIESMTHVPMGGFNPSLNERLMKKPMPEAYISMGITAENVAKKYNISRNDQDHFALMSHRKAVAAEQQGRFKKEIIPIQALTAKNGSAIIAKDEAPRADTSLEKLASLKPAFLKDGTVTAGNSSPLTDGAAMVLLGSKSFLKKKKVKALARICAMAVIGVDPAFMGIAPIYAVPKVLKRAKMKLSDIDLIELNEAFAAQSLAVLNELKLDVNKLNVNGGAIALGHPLGASGARIITTLIHAMIDRDVSTGLATMCVGGGQAVATIIERV
ncbi:MAG: acetyl-CoA C-acyltransferase [Deltaproteobacteria bacterium CG07_land_8_20_14_0_80_38_7]|nr:MAG: acetyl-CoA C-acyltransferase [Deltaproteobacteria bacterium CG07_land_8_20_14_0_80_38_7]